MPQTPLEISLCVREKAKKAKDGRETEMEYVTWSDAEESSARQYAT